MADTPIIPIAGDPKSGSAADGTNPAKPEGAAKRLWQRGGVLSSSTGLRSGKTTRVFGDIAERFLAEAGFDRAPWLAVVFASGILTWFALKTPWQWASAIGLGLLMALFALALWRERVERDQLRQAVIACSLIFVAGVSVIWLRSEVVGAQAIDRPVVERVQGYVLERQDQPSRERIRLTMAVRDAATGAGRKIRVNVPLEDVAEATEGVGEAALAEGAVLRMRVRLMPPASPMLPGAYDFARAAWFKGLSATGSLVGAIEVVNPAPQTDGIASVQRALSSHVRSRVDGSAGTIAAAFASGDRGAIAELDEDAMRDAGLTHLLAISGLHVSAVIAATYLVAIKLLALFPGLALRVRLPVMAALAGAGAGIAYTLLTGAQVPTVRSCVAAMLVLIALAMGRDALSLRMVAVAAMFVLLLWPESIVGPSFQMSFSAVLAIVAVSSSGPARAFLAAREENWLKRAGRGVVMLFITGLVIEIALMPIVMFHFHRAGVCGAFANVIAIPLVTFISMPLIALALMFDIVGLGAPFWWIVETSLNILLGIAHFTAGQPGSVKLMPQMSWLTIACFTLGGLWLALWNGRSRLLGFIPAGLAVMMLLSTPIPDLLIGREGRHVGITIEAEDGSRRLLSLRDSRSSYSRDNLLELASVTIDPIPLAEWEGARCSSEFCVITLSRGGRDWSLLLARNRELVEERALAAACERADIVVADRYLPSSCAPRWLKADRNMLERTGGLAIDLGQERIVSVASGQGEHGWWLGEGD